MTQTSSAEMHKALTAQLQVKSSHCEDAGQLSDSSPVSICSKGMTTFVLYFTIFWSSSANRFHFLGGLFISFLHGAM